MTGVWVAIGRDLAGEFHLARGQQILLVGRHEDVAAGDANLAQSVPEPSNRV